MPAKEPRPASTSASSWTATSRPASSSRSRGSTRSRTSSSTRPSIEQGRPFTRKVAGHVKWANIVLKRGVDENLELWKWRDTVIKTGADEARVDGMIEVLDISGSTIATFQFKQGWPIKYTGVTLDATTNNVALEEVQICSRGRRAGVGRLAHRRDHRPQEGVRLHDAHRVRVHASARLRRRGRKGPSRGIDASRHGPRRDRAAARPGRPAERGLPRVLLLSRVVTRIGDLTDVAPVDRRAAVCRRFRPPAAAVRAPEHRRGGGGIDHMPGASTHSKST